MCEEEKLVGYDIEVDDVEVIGEILIVGSKVSLDDLFRWVIMVLWGGDDYV